MGLQQAAECHPVRLATGQAGGHRRQQGIDAEDRGERGEFGFRGRRGRRRVAQVAPEGQMREQARVLAQQTDPALPGRDRARRRSGRAEHLPGQGDVPAAQRHQARDGFQQRGLAGAVARALPPDQGKPTTVLLLLRAWVPGGRAHRPPARPGAASCWPGRPADIVAHRTPTATGSSWCSGRPGVPTGSASPTSAKNRHVPRLDARIEICAVQARRICSVSAHGRPDRHPRRLT